MAGLSILQIIGIAIVLVAALVVLVRVMCLVAKLKRSQWIGCQWRFFTLALALALEAGGAVALMLGFSLAGFLLLVGIALQNIADRRRIPFECLR